MQRQAARIHRAAAAAADHLRGAGLAGHQIARARGHAPAGAPGLHGVHHSLAHRVEVLAAGAHRHRRRLRHIGPVGVETRAQLGDQVRAAQHAVGQAGAGAGQLQRRDLPVALADRGVDRIARIPAFLARGQLGRRRRQDAGDLAHQVDAGGLAEAVVLHVLDEALDPHVQRQPVVVGVDRGGDRLAQIGPAVAAAAGVAPAAAGARQVEHPGRQHPVLGPAHAAVEPCQRQQRLERGARRHAAQHQAVEQRPRGIAGQALVVGVGDAVDEQVGVERGQAHHGQHLAGARVERDRRALLPAEGRHHRALQVQVDAQAQVGAGLGRHHADAAQRATLDVGLHLLVADPPAQLLVVGALQAGAPGLREQHLVAPVALHVALVGATDIADHVREQVAVQVAAGEVGHDLHAGKTPAVDREPRHLFVAHALLEGDRAEPAHALARAVEARDLLLAQAHHRRQAFKHRGQVAGLLRGDVDAVGGHVVGQQPALAVVDQPARRHHRARLDAVGFRQPRVLVVIHHLQPEVPARQPEQGQHHEGEAHQRAQAELRGFGGGVADPLAPLAHQRGLRTWRSASKPRNSGTHSTMPTNGASQ